MVKYKNSDSFASEEEFVELGIKKTPTGGADGVGALGFMDKLDDMIEWGDDNAADNHNDGNFLQKKGKRQ